MSISLVAVVIPVYKEGMTLEEQISFQRCLEILQKYPIVLIAPDGLNLEAYLSSNRNLTVRRFAPEYFAGISGYNRLLMSKEFYRTFHEYDFILIYQFDCYVFRDELEYWCEKGFDYIGAPWFEGFQPHNGNGFWGVGNGGFSLRRVCSALKVLSVYRILGLLPIDRSEFARLSAYRKAHRLTGRFLKKFGWRNNSRRIIKRFDAYEDIFWSRYASLIDPDFQVAPIQEALAFSFEYSPGYCYEQNGSKLPFGCHAWNKHDTDFWRPFITELQHFGAENRESPS